MNGLAVAAAVVWAPPADVIIAHRSATAKHAQAITLADAGA